VTPDQVVFWAIIGAMVVVEVFVGTICWLCQRGVDQCHK